MKKVLLAVMIVMFAGAMVHAETPKVKSLASLIERVSGKVESVRKPDPAKGDFGSFSILGTDGQKKEFALIAKTKIYSANSGPATLDQIKKGDPLLVLYIITLKGLNEAISVTQTR
jgi:hypothetical protein